MFILSFSVFSGLLISTALLGLTTFLSKKSFNKRKKSSAFECGFNMFNKSREPFSMRFFLLAILFIIFDVEIVLIVPLLITFSNTSIFMWTLTSIMFLLILILGIMVEWKENTFTWKD